MNDGPTVLAEYRLTNPTGTPRASEPVFLDEVDADSVISVRLGDGPLAPVQRLASGGLVTILDIPEGTGPFPLTVVAAAPESDGSAITEVPAREQDAVVRLDTGPFEIELCRGTGKGTTSSKWGIRHLLAKEQGVDLIPGGDNCIGGFYAPFFTPENGLINPPEHVIADVEVLERGPLLHKYRLTGRIPDGLLPELRSKWFTIDWQFTAGSAWFERHYDISDFATEVDGRAAVNKFTVGDEFEAGPGDVLFDHFASWAGTTYREGDPYAGILANRVHQITSGISEESSPSLHAYHQAIGGDIESANWDWYWRLFSAWESFLTHDEIRAHLSEVRAEAHRAADSPAREWKTTDAALGVEVPTTEEATVFVGPSSKTAAINAGTGYAMTWWTSKPVGRFQIVQRRESGWSNWGTNGENECPELPTDVTIRAAYGRFADSWRTVAASLENPVRLEAGADR
ncbi:hypothetical protein [Micromonospora sp. NPDC005413]|uniref:hypothetical protein n=1 Tax=Micromonospora sp. NPDC005413 TaxID=3154563 RepID=UPI0033B11952